jgi:hypothetical protein
MNTWITYSRIQGGDLVPARCLGGEFPMGASISDVVSEMTSLSPEQIGEVRDFVLFLKSRPSPAVNYSDEWSDEDLSDMTKASLHYAEATIVADG